MYNSSHNVSESSLGGIDCGVNLNYYCKKNATKILLKLSLAKYPKQAFHFHIRTVRTCLHSAFNAINEHPRGYMLS